MKKQTAVKICSHWHGGQWSAIYQYCSSGEFHAPNVLRYLQEIERDLHPEYDLHPSALSKKDLTDLTGLKKYFIQLAAKNGYEIAFKEHTLYGYLIPYITKYPSKEALNKVINLLYMV